MNPYEQKQADKRKRLAARAVKLRNVAAAEFRKGDLREEFSGIPMGQPILCGHHSEAKHRNALKRADAAMRRGIEAQKLAGQIEARANTVSTAISSDDPDALDKIDAEIAKLEARQEYMKAVNAAVRKAVKNRVLGVSDGNNTYSAKAFDQFMADLNAIPGRETEISEATAKRYLQADELGRRGYPDYSTTNNSANIRRLKLRRAQLEKASEAKTVEYQVGDVTVCENVPENRLQLFFPGKPDADTRANLKSYGFRWSPTAGAWQRQLSNGARYAAECIVGKRPGDPE